jgi:hypothetical protein
VKKEQALKKIIEYRQIKKKKKSNLT